MTTKPMIPRDGWYRTQAGHLVKVTLDRFKDGEVIDDDYRYKVSGRDGQTFEAGFDCAIVSGPYEPTALAKIVDELDCKLIAIIGITPDFDDEPEENHLGEALACLKTARRLAKEMRAMLHAATP